MEFNVNYYFEYLDDKEDIIAKNIIKKSKNIIDLFVKAQEFMSKEVSEKHVQVNNAKEIGENVTIVGDYFIDEGVKLRDGCRIEGPVYIGKNCEIGYQAYIRPGTIMGDNCVVGFNSEVKNTVMRGGSKISSLAFLGDSVIGSKARVGSGVIVCNRQFNQSNIFYKDDNGEKIDSNREFLGCILGDNTRLGANCITQPGTCIGPYTWIYPLTPARGFIPAQKRVYQEVSLHYEFNEKKELKKANWRDELKK